MRKRRSTRSVDPPGNDNVGRTPERKHADIQAMRACGVTRRARNRAARVHATHTSQKQQAAKQSTRDDAGAPRGVSAKTQPMQLITLHHAAHQMQGGTIIA